MKKTIKITLIFCLVLLTMICTKSWAADEKLTYTIEVATPEEGIYGVGQEVTIKVIFNKPIKGELPKYTIYFGDDSTNLIEIDAQPITDFTTEALYKYTIKSGDNGEIKPNGFINPTQYTIEDETGNKYWLTNGVVMRFEKTILADTTIEWTDFSKATVEMKQTTSGNNNSFELVLLNCVLKTNNDYYVHLSHDANEQIVIKNKDDIHENTDFWQTSMYNANNKIYITSEEHDLFAESGSLYATICEIDKETKVPKIVLQSKEIARLPELPLTQKITAFFNEDSTHTFCWDVHSKNQQKINYKIGRVTDLKLLKSIKNGDVTALKSLLSYAKDAKNALTGTIKLGEDASIVDKLELIDEEYYYAYLELDTVNGKYAKIEDVCLYYAIVNEKAQTNFLYSQTDKNFKWNLAEENIDFTYFGNAKAIYDTIEGSLQETHISLAVYNINIDTQKKHKFYYYVSNDKQDVPDYTSELWTAADKCEKSEELNSHVIYTSDITKLSYANKIDLSKDIYISIYEVVSDTEITSNKIEGTYKLVLNAEKVVLEMDEEDDDKNSENNNKEEDNTTAKDKIPHAGVEKTIILFVAIIAIAVVILSKKCKKYRDII